jgi:hypothetical protein
MSRAGNKEIIDKKPGSSRELEARSLEPLKRDAGIGLFAGQGEVT